MTDSRLFICNNVFFPLDMSCCQMIIIFSSPHLNLNSLIMAVHRSQGSHFSNTKYGCSIVNYNFMYPIFFWHKALKSKKKFSEFLNIFMHCFSIRESCSTCGWATMRGSPAVKWSICVNYFGNLHIPYGDQNKFFSATLVSVKH